MYILVINGAFSGGRAIGIVDPLSRRLIFLVPSSAIVKAKLLGTGPSEGVPAPVSSYLIIFTRDIICLKHRGSMKNVMLAPNYSLRPVF